MDSESLFGIKSSQGDAFNKFNVNKNFSFIIDTIPDVVRTESDKEYEQFLADVWVGIVLTLMVLSCVCCMCSCLLYHKFQQWKRSVIEAQAAAANVEGGNPDTESLPSYTIVSGLPTYEEALEQLKEIRAQTTTSSLSSTTSTITTTTTASNTTNMQQLSVKDLFQIIKPTVDSSSASKG